MSDFAPFPHEKTKVAVIRTAADQRGPSVRRRLVLQRKCCR